jgi:DNA-binding SARP family transcriptional activator
MQQTVTAASKTNVVALSNGQHDRVARHLPSPIVRIHLLGIMRAAGVRHADILPRGRKARAILGYLCFAAGAPVLRSRLAAMLWDRVSKYQARASLRQALRELTVAFGPLAKHVLSIDHQTIRFDTSACWIDANALLAESPGTRSNRGKLAELCQGELLEDLDGISAAFDQWLLGKRASFAQNLRNLLASKLDETETLNAQLSEREAIARRLLDFDPTHESASRVIMRALADRNERVQALVEYKRLHTALKRSLGADPSPETRALFETIRTFGRDEVHSAQPSSSPEDEKNSAKAAAPKRSHRRVGVMPFVPLSAEVDDNLAFSLAHEVSAALARFIWFEVVAPTALMRVPAPTFLSDSELRRQDLDYVVDGSVSCSRGIYRISVRLLDLRTDASPVWNRTFELPADRLDLIDEQVTAPIVAQIDPVILYIEGHPKKRDEDDDALSCVMRALPLLNTMERANYEHGGELIKRALVLEPDNAVVLSWAAYWHVFYIGQGWAQDVEQISKIALNYAERATQLDPANAEAMAIYAHIVSFVTRDTELALHYFEMALQLNPNLPFIWVYSGLTCCYAGDPDAALERLQRCRELTASLPFFSLHENPFAIAYLMKRQYKNAIEVGRRVVHFAPAFVNGYKPLIAALGHLRRREEARPYIERLRQIEPDFSLKKFAQNYPFTQERDRRHYLDGLRRAGVPEC